MTAPSTERGKGFHDSRRRHDYLERLGRGEVQGKGRPELSGNPLLSDNLPKVGASEQRGRRFRIRSRPGGENANQNLGVEVRLHVSNIQWRVHRSECSYTGAGSTFTLNVYPEPFKRRALGEAWSPP